MTDLVTVCGTRLGLRVASRDAAYRESDDTNRSGLDSGGDADSVFGCGAAAVQACLLRWRRSKRWSLTRFSDRPRTERVSDRGGLSNVEAYVSDALDRRARHDSRGRLGLLTARRCLSRSLVSNWERLVPGMQNPSHHHPAPATNPMRAVVSMGCGVLSFGDKQGLRDLATRW